MNPTKFYVVMGVSGSGKTTIGRLLAKRLKCPFYDGDNYHPPENIAKMAAGIPLNDADRAPWLDKLHDIISQHLQAGESGILACSALKKSYRDRLRQGNENVCIIHLSGRFDLIWKRMQNRTKHYMKADMLQSQFNALEAPTSKEAIIININKPIKAVVQEIMQKINK